MKILVSNKLLKDNPNKRIIKCACGCIYEFNKDEYKHIVDNEYVVYCPECEKSEGFIFDTDDDEKEIWKPKEEPHDRGFIEVCPVGFPFCVYDPAYIKHNYPEWYKKLYGNKLPYDAARIPGHCLDHLYKDKQGHIQCHEYDTEDK